MVSAGDSVAPRGTVLVVGLHYAPENTIGALRITSMVDELRRRGWSVHVLTRQGPTVNDNEITRVVDWISCWRARVKLRGNMNNLLYRLMSGATFRFAWPDESFFWTIRAYREMKHGEIAPAIVIVSVPPFSLLLLGRRLAKLFNAHLVVDYRDLWTVGGYYESGSIRRWAESRFETRLLKRCQCVTTVSEPLARDVQPLAPQAHVHVVRNGYEPDQFRTFGYRTRSADGPLKVLYVGEIYRGKRDPTPLFEAVANDLELRSNIKIEFYGASVSLLNAMVSEWALAGVVSLHGRVSHEEALTLQDDADILLLLLWNSPREEGVYSGKLFEYLAARREILMLGYEGGVAAELIRSRGAGIVANDPASIGAILRTWVERKSANQLKPLDASVHEGLSRGEQFATLDAALRCLP